jgi:cobalt-zinc-cadmium efflux system outer membrane protein
MPTPTLAPSRRTTIQRSSRLVLLLLALIGGRAHPSAAQAPVAPVSGPVTLERLLEFADTHAPVLRAARSTRSRADAADAAAAPRMPSNPELTVYVGPRFGDMGTGVDVQVSLMQEIQIGGERGRRVEAAERFRTQTEAEIDQVRWFVHADVHAAFHRALVERERVRLAQRVVEFQAEVLRVVERQIAAGAAAPLALRLAQAEVAQAQQQLVAAEQVYAASCIRLAQLSGWPVTTPPEPVGHAESPREPPALATLQTLARERVPSLVAGRARVQATLARVAVADREAWPRPTVGVQYNREGSPTRAGAFDIIMGVVSVPIPSFQTNQGARAAARAEVVVAEAELASHARPCSTVRSQRRTARPRRRHGAPSPTGPRSCRASRRTSRCSVARSSWER